MGEPFWRKAPNTRILNTIPQLPSQEARPPGVLHKCGQGPRCPWTEVREVRPGAFTQSARARPEADGACVPAPLRLVRECARDARRGESRVTVAPSVTGASPRPTASGAGGLRVLILSSTVPCGKPNTHPGSGTRPGAPSPADPRSCKAVNRTDRVAPGENMWVRGPRRAGPRCGRQTCTPWAVRVSQGSSFSAT